MTVHENPDWLTEQGEEDRAEFIRLQVEIAGLRTGCGCGVCVTLRGGGRAAEAAGGGGKPA